MSWWSGVIGVVSICFNAYLLSRALGTSRKQLLRFLGGCFCKLFDDCCQFWLEFLNFAWIGVYGRFKIALLTFNDI